jgi:hypothetical protein
MILDFWSLFNQKSKIITKGAGMDPLLGYA